MITLRDITLRRGVKIVLEGANLVLQPGEKVGLIGRNGAGKSSLFALLTHRLSADRGDVEIPARWRVTAHTKARRPASAPHRSRPAPTIRCQARAPD
jgi:ATPase subunit of ABC transporter with duplicated ATPase domains